MSAPSKIEEALRELAKCVSNYNVTLHKPVKGSAKGGGVNIKLPKGFHQAIQGEVIINIKK